LFEGYGLKYYIKKINFVKIIYSFSYFL